MSKVLPPLRSLAGALLAGAASLAACDPTGAPPVPNGGSLESDGVGGRASLGIVEPESPLSLAGSPFTISAWFVQERGGDPYQRIIDKSDGRVGRNGWALGADAESGKIHLYAHDGIRGADFTSSRRSFETGRWHQVTAVARSDGYELWIDGRRDVGATFEEGEFALPGAAATEASIGNWNHEPGRSWKGNLDEIAVWNADLTGGEIAEIWNSRGTLDLRAVGRRYRSAGRLVGWWRMEPNDSTPTPGFLKDASVGGRDAVVISEGGEIGLRRVDRTVP